MITKLQVHESDGTLADITMDGMDILLEAAIRRRDTLTVDDSETGTILMTIEYDEKATITVDNETWSAEDAAPLFAAYLKKVIIDEATRVLDNHEDA